MNLNGTILTGNISLQGAISNTINSLTPIDTINYTAAKWGYVTGTLSDQTDLVNALNLKADVSSLATVATSGSYADLLNKPSLATVATSGDYTDLTNTPSLSTVATSGDYTDLTNTPTIPTKTSDLTNDSGFLTSAPVSSVDGKTGTVSILPQGGTTNQVLAKNSGTDYDVTWVNQSGGTEWATFGTTTYAEIDTLFNAGKTVRVLHNDVIYTLSINALGSPNIYVFSASSPSGNDFVYVQDDDVWGDTSFQFGTYSIPLTGIPKADLDSAVQTSLGLADTALQSAPVTSVNSQTGAVVLTASDVNALADNTTYVSSFNGSSGAITYSAPVTSVNGSTGAVVISNATTSSAGLMSATDKANLDAVYADYSSAILALGV